MIAEYIQNQLAEDCANDQITLKNISTRLRAPRISKQKQTAARERLLEKVMRCQTFDTPGCRGWPVIAPSRGRSNPRFNRGF